eukprot:1076120-Prymnesium_polylepis.1
MVSSAGAPSTASGSPQKSFPGSGSANVATCTVSCACGCLCRSINVEPLARRFTTPTERRDAA